MVRSLTRIAGASLLMVALTGIWMAPVAAGGGCHGQTGAATDAVETSVVVIDDCAFSPATIQVDSGDTVTFNNKDVIPHTATGADWNTDILEQGDSAKVTFDESGTYAYYCELHPGMTATVVVGDGESAAAAPAGPAAPASPSSDEDSYVLTVALATATALLGFAAGRFWRPKTASDVTVAATEASASH